MTARLLHRPDADRRGFAACFHTSSVVGYQNNDLTNGDFNWVCHSFKPISGSLWTLGDLIPGENFSLSTLQFVTGTGATKKFLLPNGDLVSGQFEYWRADEIDDADLPDGATAVSGWYLWNADEDAMYLMNSVQIPEGGCFAVDARDTGATIGGAGQVDSEDTVCPLVKGDFNWFGNCTPINLTLGDITVNDEFSLSTLQFVTGTGATKKFTLPNNDLVSGQFEYWRADEIDDADLPDGATAVTGWYLWNADEDAMYLMNATPVASGSGFAVDARDTDASIIIPSAL